jgi:hypothetical protein
MQKDVMARAIDLLLVAGLFGVQALIAVKGVPMLGL